MTNDPRVLQILQQRAAILAQPVTEPATTTTVELLMLSVADGTRLGVETRHVLQILPNEGMCALPEACGDLVGLIATRGDAAAVADLACLLEPGTPDRTRALVVVLGGAGATPVGVLVDEVHEVVRLAQPDLHHYERRSSAAAHVLGLTSDGAVVLDGAALLADPRLTVARRSTSSAPSTSQDWEAPCDV